MSAASQSRNTSETQPRSGGSLTWFLFPSIVGTMVVVFLAVQALQIVPNVGPESFEARMKPHNLAREAAESLPLILLILCTMMAGVLMALRFGLRPLRRISEQAALIGPATISRRLPLSETPREIAPLVTAFNAALDRLEAGLRSQRDFSANAAHELRTPLAILRAQVESNLAPAERSGAIEEFDRMSRLIAQLLALAEADNGTDLPRTSFNLVELTRTVTSDMAGAIVVGDRNIAFETRLEYWKCEGVPGLVELAIRNLLDNAIRHTPAGSEILVSLDAEGALRVCDDGPGVPDALQPRLFQRFTKADTHGSGAGLGLSIVEKVMHIHHGAVRLEPETWGACFVLDFGSHGVGPDGDAAQRSGSRLAKFA